MKICGNCGHETDQATDIFCSQCGTRLSEQEEVPFVGESASRGIWRINFGSVEAEFENEDQVNDALKHSCWGEDHSFENVTTEFIRSTVPPKEFPFICGKCREYVASNPKGRCPGCGEVIWIAREE